MDSHCNALENAIATLVGHNDLIVDKILSYLEVRVLKRCRQVSIKWYKICEKYMKKKAVITLNLDGTLQNNHTPKKFMKTFKRAPLKNTFGGVRIVLNGTPIIATRFKWITHYPNYLPVNRYDETYPHLMEFISRYGPQLSYFELKIVDGVHLSYHLFDLKNILVDYIPNIEHLNVLVEKGYNNEHADERFPTISSTPVPDAIKLNKLEKIEWKIIPRYPRELENLLKLYTPALNDLIAHAPNLTSIATEGSYLTLDVFKTLNSDTMCSLKEIIVDPLNGDHSVEPMLTQLKDLGNMNLKLESFDVKMTTHSYGDEDILWTLFYRSTSEFLSTQKNCLKILKIRIQPQEAYLGNPTNIPAFLEMTKLEHLELYFTDDSAFKMMFGGFESWTTFFPNLKSLNLTWLDAFAREDDMTNLWSNLLTDLIATHNNLQVLKVISKSSPFHIDAQQCNELYISLKPKFPNLKTFEICEQFGELLYCFKPNNIPPVFVFNDIYIDRMPRYSSLYPLPIKKNKD